MAVLYPGHPLSGHNHLSYQDLAQEDFIIMQPHGRATDEAEEVLLCYNRGGFIPHIISRDREVQTVLLEVSAGFGIAILPEYAVRYYYNEISLFFLCCEAMAHRRRWILRLSGKQKTAILPSKNCCSGWKPTIIRNRHRKRFSRFSPDFSAAGGSAVIFSLRLRTDHFKCPIQI